MEEQEVKTITQARNRAEYIVKAIDEGNDKNKSLKNQCSSMILNILESDSEDFDLRTQALDISRFSNETLKELRCLDDRYYQNENSKELYNWFKIVNVDLLNYVPNTHVRSEDGKLYPNTISQVKDMEGKVYNSVIEDLLPSFVLFKRWVYPEPTGVGKRKISFAVNADRDDVRDNYDADKEKELYWEYRKRGMFLKHGGNPFYYYEWDTDENKKKIVDLRAVKKDIDDLDIKIDELQNYIDDNEKNYRVWKDYMWSHESGYYDGSGYFHYYPDWEDCYDNARYYENTISRRNDLKRRKDDKLNYKKGLEESLQPSKRVGSYYDDDYLIQREIRKIHSEKKDFVTGVNVKKNMWGKVTSVSETKERLVVEVEDYTRQTLQDPLFPDYKNFSSISSRGWSSNCLVEALSMVENLRASNEGTSEAPSFFKELKYSYNDFDSSEDKTIIKELLSEKTDLYNVTKIFSEIPNCLFYENKELNRFMIVRVIKKEIVPFDPTLKPEYEKRYNLCVNSDLEPDKEFVKFLVYDNDELITFYKDFKYKIRLELKLEYSNLSEDELDIKYIPVIRISDSAFTRSCNYYKNIILSYLKRSFDSYSKTPISLRCEDGNPFDEYGRDIKYLENFPNITNTTIARSFVEYCKKIKKWANERISNLKYSVDDIEIKDKFFNIMSLRLRKGSGTLPIWYQSVLNFDDSYINNLTSDKVLIENAQSMFVTTGYDYNNGGMDEDHYNDKNVKLFNAIDHPDFIDIKDLDNKIYEGKKFEEGKEVYIFRGISQHKNRILKNDGVVEIKRFDKQNSYEGNSIEDENLTEVQRTEKELENLVKTERVTRLKLAYPLPSWCKTDEPQNIIICQLRTKKRKEEEPKGSWGLSQNSGSNNNNGIDIWGHKASEPSKEESKDIWGRNK